MIWGQVQRQHYFSLRFLLHAIHFSRSKPPAVGLSTQTLSLVLSHCCVTHSLSVPRPRPAATDASSRPLTLDLMLVPIFGVNELLMLLHRRKLHLHRCLECPSVSGWAHGSGLRSMMMKWRQVSCNRALFIPPSQDLWSGSSVLKEWAAINLRM